MQGISQPINGKLRKYINGNLLHWKGLRQYFVRFLNFISERLYRMNVLPQNRYIFFCPDYDSVFYNLTFFLLLFSPIQNVNTDS